MHTRQKKFYSLFWFFRESNFYASQILTAQNQIFYRGRQLFFVQIYLLQHNGILLQHNEVLLQRNEVLLQHNEVLLQHNEVFSEHKRAKIRGKSRIVHVLGLGALCCNVMTPPAGLPENVDSEGHRFM